MKPVDLGPANLHPLRNQSVQEPAPDTTQNTPETQGTDTSPSVEVTLSADAQVFLQQGGPPPHSTAGKARQALGATSGLASVPFGKIVSAIAHGINPASLIAIPEETGETAPQDDEGVVDSPILGEPVASEEPVEEPIVEDPPVEEPIVQETPADASDPILQDADIALALLSQDTEEEDLLF